MFSKDFMLELGDLWAKNKQTGGGLKYNLHEPTFGIDEIAAVVEVMLSTQVTMGKKVADFEAKLAEKFNVSFAITSNSGSSANLLAMSSLCSDLYSRKIPPGSEIICPAVSWSTSVWPIIQMGCRPVFVDSDPQTLNVIPEAIESAVTDNTKAVLIIPIYGNPCNMSAITEICDRRGLILFEDCCESMGAHYDGKSVGSFGDVSTFSFYFSHHITTLEGGVTLTNDPELADIMRIQRSHGWVRDSDRKMDYFEQYPNFDEKFLFVDTGYNIRLTEPQAAMGLLQLEKLDEFVCARQKLALKYLANLAGYEASLQTVKTTPEVKSSWFGFPIILKKGTSRTVKEIRDYLRSFGIETRPLVAGDITRQPALISKDYRIAGDLLGASKIMDLGFSLPCHQSLEEADVDFISQKLIQGIDMYAL